MSNLNSSTRIHQTMHLLKAELAVDDDRLRFSADQIPVINCSNGELWIKDDGSVDFRPHNPESYLRHCLDITYEPDAECPLYDEAVEEIFAEAENPKAMVRHWNELLGYFIAPHRKIPKIIVLKGTGANGKTKLMETATRLIGSEYVAAGRLDSLNDRFAIGNLLGKKLFLDDDVSSGVRLPDGELKKISEPKTVTGERKYGPQFNFVVRVVPVLICNNVPSIADLTYGMERRLMVIPFDRSFRGKDDDLDLFPKIWATETSGVLNRALAGLARLNEREGRFKEPSDVRKATNRLLAEANPLPAFIEECCTIENGAKCWMREFYSRFSGWSEEMGFTRVQQQLTVRRNLTNLGYQVKHGNQGNRVYGLELKTS